MLAIAGAGHIAGALAHRVASREHFREVRLIDESGTQASGKALDIRQAGPIERYDTRVTGHTSLDAAAGASVVAIADRVDGTEWSGDAGLAMLRSLLPMAGEAALLFVGANQTWLMEAAYRELNVPASRMAGSAPGALEGALRALTALALDTAAVDIDLRISGRVPDRVVIGWSSALAAGSPLESVLAPHQRFAIAERAKGLWPPGPAALGSAAARVAEALASGSRRTFTCLVVGEGFADSADSYRLPRGMAMAMPVSIERGRVIKVRRPVLSVREQVEFDNSL
jgi:malate dehydrogenase